MVRDANAQILVLPRLLSIRSEGGGGLSSLRVLLKGGSCILSDSGVLKVDCGS